MSLGTRLLLAVLAVSSLSLACRGTDAPTQPVVSTDSVVTPTPVPVEFHVGAGVLLAAGDSMKASSSVRYASGPGYWQVSAQWAVRDTTIVAVDTAGILRGRRAGTTWAVASYMGFRDSMVVAVWTPAFYIAPDTNVVPLGTTRRLQPRSYSREKGIVASTASAWSSSDASVVRVDAQGQLTPVATGHATITAVRDSAHATAEVFVTSYGHPLVFTSVATSTEVACGLESDGTAYCWGGQSLRRFPMPLADRCESAPYVPASRAFTGGFVRSVDHCVLAPMKLPTALRFRSFAATNGSEISLIATDGTLYRLGETGLVAPVPSYRFKRVASSDTRTCAIMSDDRGACWGSTFAGALGNGIAKTLGPGPSTPQPLVGDLVWKELHTTRYLSCGLTLDGRAYCWGDNRDYRLGVGAGTAATGDCLEHCVTVPTAVRTSVLFSAIASGETDNCGIALDGGTWCWGALPAGVDPMSAAAEPVRVATPPFVSLTDDNLCGLTATGEVYCYTRNGAATTQADRYAFTKLAIPFAVTEFSFGSYSPACARSAQDGALYCWGTAPGTGSGDLATTTVTQPAKVAGQAP